MSRARGWCPSAHAPMMSGDGLLVRVKPRLGRLTADAVTTLCDLAERYGSGLIDVTSRANLQMRGVAEGDHASLLQDLIATGLVDPSPAREARMITITPYWQPGDLTVRLTEAVAQTDLPDLPDKMGIVIDTGPEPVLRDVSGDFRFEQVAGQLTLRADGADHARVIAQADATGALREMADWFAATGGAQSRRMSRHLKHTALPEHCQDTPAATRPGLDPGPHAHDPEHFTAYGLAFGQTTAQALRMLIVETGASHLRVTPWRVLLLENAHPIDTRDFLAPDDPLLAVSACPGAPLCAQATVETRDLARHLATTTQGTLHISGCAKGCARPKAAALTLVGRDGHFDLVRDGRAGDTPIQSGLTAAQARLVEQ